VRHAAQALWKKKVLSFFAGFARKRRAGTLPSAAQAAVHSARAEQKARQEEPQPRVLHAVAGSSHPPRAASPTRATAFAASLPRRARAPQATEGTRQAVLRQVMPPAEARR